MNKDGAVNAMCNLSFEEFELRRGPWTLEEDNLLIQHIACNGEGRWNALAKCAGLQRTGKSCRLRWLNYLKPDIKRGNLTPQEQILILELHSKWGNRWSKIAQNLPGRTDNEIKNYWRTRVQKQARQLKVDANSKTFLEAIRCFWMPRLLEKMEQSSSLSASSSSSSISPFPNHQNSTHNSIFPSPFSTSRKLMDTNNAKEEKSNTSNHYSERVVKLLQSEENPINSAEICTSIQDDCYPLDVTRYSAECFSQQAISTLGSQDNFLSEYLMAENDWINDEIAGAFWNTDELWQFRKADEA